MTGAGGAAGATGALGAAGGAAAGRGAAGRAIGSIDAECDPRITEAEFSEQVERATVPVVVDFYATGCGPCKVLSPMLDKVAGEYSGKIEVVKVNVDEAQSLAERFQVSAIPTLLFVRNGKVEDRVTGLLAEDELKSRLDNLIR